MDAVGVAAAGGRADWEGGEMMTLSCPEDDDVAAVGVSSPSSASGGKVSTIPSADREVEDTLRRPGRCVFPADLGVEVLLSCWL